MVANIENDSMMFHKIKKIKKKRRKEAKKKLHLSFTYVEDWRFWLEVEGHVDQVVDGL